MRSVDEVLRILDRLEAAVAVGDKARIAVCMRQYELAEDRACTQVEALARMLLEREEQGRGE